MAIVCKTVRPMLSVCCLSCPVLSVCDFRALWPNGCTDQDETWHAGRSRPWPHCVRWGPSSPPVKEHSPPNFRPIRNATRIRQRVGSGSFRCQCPYSAKRMLICWTCCLLHPQYQGGGKKLRSEHYLKYRYQHRSNPLTTVQSLLHQS